jgi:hypothetical protein
MEKRKSEKDCSLLERLNEAKADKQKQIGSF